MKDRGGRRGGGDGGGTKGKGRRRGSANETVVGVGSSLYLQATIKYHLATDVVKNWKVEDGLRRIFSSAMGRIADDDVHSSLLSEWGGLDDGDDGIRSGELVTTEGSYELRLSPTSRGGGGGGGASFFRRRRRRRPALTANDEMSPSSPDDGKDMDAVVPGNGPPSNDGPNASSMTSSSNRRISLSHDMPKNVPISPSSTFLRMLGVTNAQGKPMAGMSSKLRQCQKFVEIVGNLVDDCAIMPDTHDKIRVIDMGCGRGYLTFSLHSYLCDKFCGGGIATRGGDGRDGVIAVETRGIDRRPKLIEEINGIAAKLGGDFASLSFDEGTIGNAVARDNDIFGNENCGDRRSSTSGNGNGKSTLDVVIALHACDTATDDALHFALCRNADVIVVAPCCQYELRSQIDRHVTLTTSSSTTQQQYPLADVLRHPIYRERATETVTDAMRATLLEIAGYDVRVFEFVGGEHSAKNVMIAATKSPRERSHEYRRNRRGSLASLARFYGIERQRLAALMGESVTGGQEDIPMKNGSRNLSGMPPL
ncbi:hypothetical protein ACHAXA_006001 [Cyclostephanos tholiformis]|uniref:Methyltransferase domain-containing protein n=1 Tax=Cyclostephanos tholiformis TaxID=382380 RepID=A0ABD3SRC2_9STRA